MGERYIGLAGPAEATLVTPPPAQNSALSGSANSAVKTAGPRLGGGSRVDGVDLGGFGSGFLLPCQLFSHWDPCLQLPRPRAEFSGTKQPTPNAGRWTEFL